MSCCGSFIYIGYYSTACVYFSFRWGPFVHSLGIVQWNFTRRDHPGNPGRVSGSGLIIFVIRIVCHIDYKMDRNGVALVIVDFYRSIIDFNVIKCHLMEIRSIEQHPNNCLRKMFYIN